MAKIYTGRDGSLLVGGTTQLKVTNWSVQGDLETLETTTLGDNFRSYTPGIQGYSGSATLLYYKDDAGRNDASTLIKKVIKTSGTTTADIVVLTLRLTDTTNSDIKVNAYITSASFGLSVGEIVTANINFQVTGAPSEVTI